MERLPVLISYGITLDFHLTIVRTDYQHYLEEFQSGKQNHRPNSIATRIVKTFNHFKTSSITVNLILGDLHIVEDKQVPRHPAATAALAL